MSQHNAVLRVEHLTKKYTKGYRWWGSQLTQVAVNAISFSMFEGEILGFLGLNGAGKTTTIQMLLSTLKPTSGTITYFGKDFSTHRSEILRQVGFASSFARLPGRLTLWENLDLYGKLYGLPQGYRYEQIKKFLNYFDLWHMKDQEAGVLSSGENARLMLAKAFIANPKIVLLDELFAPLDPASAYMLRSFVLEQRNQHGTSILFTSHNMHEVAVLCDRVLVLKKGDIIANSSPEQLAASVCLNKVKLCIPHDLEKAVLYANREQIAIAHDGQQVVFEVDENRVAHLLRTLTLHDVHYTEVAIVRPQLEDYFLQLEGRRLA